MSEGEGNYSTHSCSGDLEEDGFDCCLAQSDCSGYLNLPHITHVLWQETHCLQVYTFGKLLHPCYKTTKNTHTHNFWC